MRFEVRRSFVAASSIVAVLALVATIGFAGIFDGWAFLAAAIIGAVGATVASVATRALGLLLAESLAVSLVGFALLGGVATGGIPTPSAYRSFADGLINGWAELLSSTPPAALTAEFRVIPFTVAWVSAMIAGALLRSERRGLLAIVGPIVGLVAATLLTIENRTVALGQGAVLAAGGLLLGFVDHRRRHGDRADIGHDSANGDDDEIAASWWSTPTARNAGALTTAAMVAGVAVLVGPQLPFVDDNDRFDLRQFQTPPFDPLLAPTPLSQVKVGLQDANADRALFTVASDRPVERLTLAVLDDYNNQFWTVADEADAPAEFRPVDDVLPAPTDGTVDGWERIEATITITDLDGVGGGDFEPPWLPVPGWPLGVASDDPLDIRFNDATGTVALAPDGPSNGLTYDVTAAVAPSADDPRLPKATVTLRETYDLAVPQLRSYASDTLEGADVGYQQIDAIQQRLVELGAYDSRAGSAAGRPGHSLGRLAEFTDDPERLVAFEEQYAATAALLARSEGLPARVAVGFAITPDDLVERTASAETDALGRSIVPVFGDDIAAWVEVRFDGIGWVPFDVTPPRDRAPDDAPLGRTEREVAVPEPPPEPPPPVLPPDLDITVDPEEDVAEPEEEEEPEPAGGVGIRPFVVGGVAASPLILLVVFVIVVLALKRRRTARRRHAATPALRVAGAWHEVMDRMTERGAKLPVAATRRERARGLADAELIASEEGDVLLALADDVDRSVFHPQPAGADVATQAWDRADRVCAEVDSAMSTTRRLRRRVDPRPLLHRDPLLRTHDDETDVGNETHTDIDGPVLR